MEEIGCLIERLCSQPEISSIDVRCLTDLFDQAVQKNRTLTVHTMLCIVFERNENLAYPWIDLRFCILVACCVRAGCRQAFQLCQQILMTLVSQVHPDHQLQVYEWSAQLEKLESSGNEEKEIEEPVDEDYLAGLESSDPAECRAYFSHAAQRGHVNSMVRIAKFLPSDAAEESLKRAVAIDPGCALNLFEYYKSNGKFAEAYATLATAGPLIGYLSFAELCEPDKAEEYIMAAQCASFRFLSTVVSIVQMRPQG
eukprot:GILK01011704.1.p1 GENE.GILK01011704.1~~GILK01011704.1.p1  ORF type:complete len:255 (-),score=21.66 GILK01011704.1:328-1092(-)